MNDAIQIEKDIAMKVVDSFACEFSAGFLYSLDVGEAISLKLFEE